nr:fimbrillin family protein [Prevotella sp.]
MKKKTYLFALMAMALTLGSCSDNENGIGGETSKYITVSTSIGNMTRVATDEKGGQTFEEGDEISVYAWTGDATIAPETRERVVNNAINKLTNGSWVSTPQMLWKNNRDKHYFIGVYPTAAISDLTAGEYTFDVNKQTESDLLVAVNKDGLSYNVDEQQTVPLTFTHVMAKLVVNLTYKNQWGTEGPTVEKVAVGNAAKKATVNYLTKAVTPSAVAEDKADFDMPALTANKQYASIIIPQDGVQKITITIGGKDFIYDNGTPFKFESGKITIVNLEVGRDVIKLGDVNISDWGSTGEPIKGEAYD